MKVELKIGDCLDVLKEYPENHFDSCVTDPPYGLEFMGKEWDKLAMPEPGNLGGFADGNKPSFERVKHYLPAMQEWHKLWAREVLRVLKPGACLLAFGGTRTFHRLTCALEDAGFEIRDCLMWLYGSGFPKSLDVSKAIGKAAGAEREVIGTKPGHDNFVGRTKHPGFSGDHRPWMENEEAVERYHNATAPATPEAAKWSGWGTALKPAWEPIILARKPLIGTVAENVLEYGTGGLNIDGTRIGIDVVKSRKDGGFGANFMDDAWKPEPLSPCQPHQGRWPANVILDEEAARQLDAQTGVLTSGKGPLRRGSTTGNSIGYGGQPQAFDGSATQIGDSGGASRFFYMAKASRAERDYAFKETRNTHPTVKPVELMRYLVRLVTPPGGLVLDPFVGSGTTLIAAKLEEFRALGIEKEPEYEPIIRERMKAWAPIDNYGDETP